MSSDPHFEEIRQRITKRYANRPQFFGHLAAFVVVNGLGWLLLWPLPGILFYAALFVSGSWFLGLLIHTINFIMTEARENAIEQAIEAERRWRDMPEQEMKRKRERLTLNDDGEIETTYDDATSWAEKRNQRL